jgi:uncharacterized protein (DUF433 family)
MTWVPVPGVNKTPGVCGGDACVGDHRIPVWMLVLAQRSGRGDAAILADYPQLAQADLDAGWEYYRANPVEIERAIWVNDVAGNVPIGHAPPAAVLVAGKLLGLSDDDVAAGFDPPATAAQIAAAWHAYRADPPRVDRELATLRRAG